ncbi:MAG: hypothetical protein JRG81_00045 [Deltaproteobacteria bacterium]|nr:hypothetical protein [Deltaproteobacteria bacterium]MBW2363468.1 hypothetical protein [Deltaproteobacteria bacterium]
MAIAVLTNKPTVIDNAESTAQWDGDTFVLEADNKVQGDNSVACIFTPSASQEVWVDGSWDLSGGEHLRLWMNNTITAYLQSEALDGIQIFVSDGTNEDYWTVGGADTYGGGWKQFVVDTTSTPTEDNGAVHSTITRIGIRMNVHTRPKNATNLWLDAWTYGDGYTVTGGTSGDDIDWSHVADLDLVDAFGIVTRIDDIYFFAGAVIVGNGATTTYFASGQKVQFKDLPVNSTLYGVTFEGSACNIDIAGGSYGAAAAQDFFIDASDTNLNSFDLTGVQFEKASSAIFAAGENITSNVFNNCGQITPGLSIFQNNTIGGYTGTLAAVLAPAVVTNFKNNIYVNNTDVTNDPAAIEYDAVGSYGSDGDTFDNNDYDVLNSDNAATITDTNFVIDRGYKILTVSGSDFTTIGAADNNIGTKFVATGTDAGGTGTATEVLVLNKANESNPSTANNTGTNADTLFVGAVPVSVTVLNDDTGLPIGTTCRVRVMLDSDKSPILSIACNASGIAATTYSGATPVDIVGWAREFNISAPDFVQQNFSGEITSSGFSLTIRLKPI